MLYNDRSVQENHHISAAFGVLNRVSLSLFSYCIGDEISIYSNSCVLFSARNKYFGKFIFSRI